MGIEPLVHQGFTYGRSIENPAIFYEVVEIIAQRRRIFLRLLKRDGIDVGISL